MDIDMPVMNGIDATKLIRKYEHAMGRRTPILAISSFDRPQDRQRCIRAGLDGLMEKGLRADEIMSIINSYDQDDPSTAVSVAKGQIANDHIVAFLGDIQVLTVDSMV